MTAITNPNKPPNRISFMFTPSRVAPEGGYKVKLLCKLNLTSLSLLNAKFRQNLSQDKFL
jgi:hypothetical protein